MKSDMKIRALAIAETGEDALKREFKEEMNTEIISIKFSTRMA